MFKNIKTLKTILIVLRIVLILVAIFLIFFLFYQDLIPSGILIAENNISEKSALFSDFFPQARIREEECDKNDCWQTMFYEPLYFDFIIPRYFEKVKVSFIYQNPQNIPLKIGLIDRTKDWSFQLEEPIEQKRDDYLGEWQLGEVELVIAPEYILDRKLRFIISAPGIEAERGEIKINSLRLVLEREPLTWNKFFLKTKEYFLKKFIRS